MLKAYITAGRGDVDKIELAPMQGYYLAMLMTGLTEIVTGAALYAVTWLNLKKRLNLA